MALRFANAYNIRAQGSFATAGSQLKLWVRHKIVIGTNNFSSLSFIFPGTVFGFNGEVNVGNNYTIEKCALEKQSGGAAFTPVLFSGVRSTVVVDGTAGATSDGVLPGAFGLATFTRGDVYWLRALISVANNTCKWPSDGKVNNQLDVNNTSFQHDPTYYTIPDTDGTGAFTYTTTGTGDSGFGFLGQPGIITIGEPVNANGHYPVGIGDSIMNAFGDATTGQPPGFFMKALWANSSYNTSPIAGCCIGANSATASVWQDTANTHTKALLQYGTVTVEEMGTNGPQYDRSSQIWSLAKSYGHKVIRTKLMTHTNSTDSFATVANQTPLNATYVTPTGDRPVFSAAVAAQEGILFDKFLSFDTAVLDGTNRDKWKAPGYTLDGLHPTTLAYEAMAVVLRAAFSTLASTTATQPTEVKRYATPSPGVFGTSVSLTIDPPAAGNTLLILAGMQNTPANFVSVTTNMGETPVLDYAPSVVNGRNNARFLRLFNPSTSTTTITINVSSNDIIGLVVVEVAGLANAVPTYTGAMLGSAVGAVNSYTVIPASIGFAFGAILGGNSSSGFSPAMSTAAGIVGQAAAFWGQVAAAGSQTLAATLAAADGGAPINFVSYSSASASPGFASASSNRFNSSPRHIFGNRR